MNTIFTTLLFTFLTLLLSSQPDVASKDKNYETRIEYLTKNWRVTKNKEKARYYHYTTFYYGKKILELDLHFDSKSELTMGGKIRSTDESSLTLLDGTYQLKTKKGEPYSDVIFKNGEMLNYTHYRTVENESIAYEVIDMSDSCKDDPYSYHATVYDKIGEIKNSGYVMKYKKRYGLIVWK